MGQEQQVRGEGTPKSPEQKQREVLGPQEEQIGSFQEQVEALLRGIPLGYAQTPLGAELADVLGRVDDDLTSTRTAIRGEIRPVVETKRPKRSKFS